jgi:hypothetical protein
MEFDFYLGVLTRVFTPEQTIVKQRSKSFGNNSPMSEFASKPRKKKQQTNGKPNQQK